MSQRFVAELTALPTRKECGYKANCRGQRIYNQSVEFQFVENVDPTQPGRDCCPACTRYLRSKATTVHNLEPNPATTDREVWIGENEAKIYQMINQNQRKSGHRHRVAAMGPPPVPTAALSGSVRSLSHQVAQGVNVAVPGTGALLQSPMMGFAEPPMPSGPGYTPDHAEHARFTNYYKQRAIGVHNGHVGNVHLRLCEHSGVKRALLWDINPIVKDVPVHIGAQELKRFAHRHIVAHYNEHMQEVQRENPEVPYIELGIDDVALCNSHGVEHDMELAKDVIASHWYKDWSAKTGNRGQFKGDKAPVTVLLVVSKKWKRRYDQTMEQAEFNTRVHSSESPSKKPTKAKVRQYGRTTPVSENELKAPRAHMRRPVLTVERSDSECDEAGTPPHSITYASIDRQSTGRRTPPRSTSAPAVVITSPEAPATLLRDALAQQHHTALKSQPLLAKDNQNGFSCIFYPAKRVELSTLLQIPRTEEVGSDAFQWLDKSGYYEVARMVHLEVEFKPHNRKTGAFKVAFLGTSNSPLLQVLHVPGTTGRYNIVAKCVFQTNTTACLSLHKAPRQLQDLGMEVRCLIFGHAFLTLVYNYIDKWCAEKEETRATSQVAGGIPNVCFVGAGIAIQHRAGDNPRVMLLEERIPGSFTKYINNANAEILPQRNAEETQMARFLAFTQHVQYWKTKKQAFVTDYQGAGGLLTDPQILTNPDLDPGSVLFTTANIDAGYMAFELTHQCNEYCEYFNLPTDWDAMEDWVATAPPSKAKTAGNANRKGKAPAKRVWVDVDKDVETENGVKDMDLSAASSSRASKLAKRA